MANLKFYKGGSAPATITEGGIWFNTSNHTIQVKTSTGYDVFGVGVRSASLTAGKLTIVNEDERKIEVDFNDIASATSVAEALAKKVDKVNGKGLSTNDYTDIEKNKLSGIATNAQVNVIETVKVNGTALTPDDSKAVNIVIPAATVTGVVSTDKVLSMDGTLVKSEVGLKYDSTTKKIQLTGKSGAVIESIDATAFIKDGMLESAELVVNPTEHDAGTYLVLSFNTDSGSEPIYVDVTKLIDVYTSGNGITITNKSIAINDSYVNNLIATKVNNINKSDTAVATQLVSAVSQSNGVITVSRRTLVAADIPSISVAKLSDLDATKVDLSSTYATASAYSAPKAGDSVETAVGKLAKGIADAAVSGVTSFNGSTGAITVDTEATANGSVKFAVSSNKLTGTVTGLKSAAYVETSAFDTAGAANTVKTTVIGTSSDTATANTIYGAKAHADSKASTALQDAKDYADGLASNYATSTQGSKADTALQSISKGTDGNYVTTTVGAKGSSTSQTIGVAVKVQAIESASTSAKGLLEASDAKTYIDNQISASLAWEEFE